MKPTYKDLEKIIKHGPALAKESFIAGWTDIVGTSLQEFLEKKNPEAKILWTT